MMDNSFETFLLYYFSAIAQVVAAIIALGGVFLVFYMQSLKNGIIKISKKLAKEIDNVLIYNKLLKGTDEYEALVYYTRQFFMFTEYENEFEICSTFKNFTLKKFINDLFDLIEKQETKEPVIDYRKILNTYSDILDMMIVDRNQSFKYFKRSFIFGSVVILLSLPSILFSYFKILPLNIIAVVTTFILTILVLINIYKIVKTSFD